MNLLAWLKWAWSAFFPAKKPVLQSPSMPQPTTPAPTTQTSTPVPASPKGQPTFITQFCSLIQTYEGWILPGGSDAAGNIYPEGSPAYRNNNPGNERCEANDEADWPSLATGSSAGDFCEFKTYQSGWQTLVNGVTAICLGNVPSTNPYAEAAKKLGLANCAQLTIAQFFVVRDPPVDDNDPNAYSAFIGKGLGVDSNTFRMAQLVE